MLTDMTDALAEALAADLPQGALRRTQAHHLEEPRGKWRGRPGWVASPGDADEAARILRFAADRRVPLLPYGGGTGLVGGQVAPDGPLPLLVSMDRMTAIRAVHPEENVLVAEAGAVLADVQAAASEAGRLFPLSLASEGSARIGGLLGTNAGGINVLRYGTARELCLGLEAVLPDGSIWNGLRRLRKDNTGYDLRDLLIGAEGTLGLITAASLRLFPRPARVNAALFVVPDPAAAVALLAMAQQRAGGGLSAYELISGIGLHFLTEADVPVRQPFAEPPDWMVLIELGLPEALNPDDVLTDLFEAALGAGLAEDGLIAQSEGQRAEFWAMRERIPEANRRIEAIASNDIALPVSEVPDFIARSGAALAALGDMRINCFGHLGDGNLHYNIFPARGRRAADYPGMGDRARRVVDDLVAQMGGSFSAEHGIGRLKVETLERYGDPAKLAAMHAIKRALDPLGIMNPGAVLRAQD